MTTILEKNIGYAEFPLAYPMERSESCPSLLSCLLAAVPAPGNAGALLLRPFVELVAVCLILEWSCHHEHIGGESSCGSGHQKEPFAGSWRSWRRLLSECRNHAHQKHQDKGYNHQFSHRVLLSRYDLISPKHHAWISYHPSTIGFSCQGRQKITISGVSRLLNLWIKEFSSPKIKIWFEPMFFSGFFCGFERCGSEIILT